MCNAEFSEKEDRDLQNQPPARHDPIMLGYECYDDRLEDDASRLFVTDERVCIKVTEIGGKGKECSEIHLAQAR